jgi:hypothetical protein
MRVPHHLFQASTFRAEPLMAAMAVVSISMFIGAWVIGPAITRNSTDAPPVQSSPMPDKTTFDAMVARPDPPPYRAATPAFDLTGPPNYAAAAKQKAQAELGGPASDDDAAVPEAPSPYRGGSSRYRPYDRHKVY